MLGKHGTAPFDPVGPLTAIINHGDHSHVMTLAPSPLGGVVWDAVVVHYNDGSLDVILFDEVMQTMPEGTDTFTQGDVLRAFGIDWDDVYGTAPAIVLAHEVVSNN